MTLPVNPLPRETVKIGGHEVDIRSLHLFEVRRLQAMDPDESDAQAIAWAVGVDPDEAAEWIRSSPGGDAIELLAAIMRLSGWDPEAPARFPA